jgi:ATP-dependent helicase/nuclease subunit A
MTRASTALVVSGTPLVRQTQSWHQRVRDALASGGNTRTSLTALSLVTPAAVVADDPSVAQLRPVGVPLPAGRRVDAIGTAEARAGVAFHALMERTTGPDAARYGAEERLAGLEVTAADAAALEAAARSLAAMPALRRFYDPAQYRRAANEVPLIDPAGNVLRIDRLVEFDDAVWILDYKTTQRVTADDVARAAAVHRPQLERYREAVRPFAGRRTVHALVVFAGGAHCEL